MRCRQRILKWLVAAVFAAVAVGGQALHDLPGCGHGLCGLASHAKGHACCSGHHGHHDCDDEQPASGGSESHSTGADCLICKFFSQGKILEAPSVTVEALPLVAAVSPVRQAFYPIANALAFDARGPPAAA